MINFLKNKDRYKYVLLIIVLIMLKVSYLLINTLDMRKHHLMSHLDNYIPFISWMVIPYVLWYLYIWGILLYLLIKDKKLFITHSLAVILGQTICLIIFLLYPTYVIRPEVVGSDIFSKLVLLIYSNDNPVNAFPSVHVLQSVLTHIAILNIKNIKKSVKISSYVFSTMVILSTITIKQHYVIDVAGGYLLAAICAKFVYETFYQRYKANTLDVIFSTNK
ncbi:PAP2 superfamily protein [Caloranaerobacter azorensis DSM 13643]|uniref:PAP2 superfamily protein n=1 Tax=Caloranaerobacter azorensis DSM 13643 TaxID=1121264 RepID=A0A1M5SNI8_9FIRM|nr:phosphatase PAP2 family protein [Caloranaerobacter azorensis]SHH40065.1 PAP2 superfamily protein [Caloranaerobacter azorensis DSM 13643]